MTDIPSQAREHDGATNITDRIKSALATIALEDQLLTAGWRRPCFSDLRQPAKWVG